MRLSIVIPAYNEAENIKATINMLLSSIETLPKLGGFEVIVVDDCSTDGTYGRVVSIGDPRIGCIRLSRRAGSHTALRAGIKESTGDAVLCISADGQDVPSCLGTMIGKLEKGSNVIWALRTSRKDEPWIARMPAKVFYKLLFRMLNQKDSKIDLSRASFFMLDRVVIDAINSCPERNTSLFGLIAWLGFNQDSVESERRLRLSGGSKWSFKSRFRLAKDWIIAFSGLPLKMASLTGIFISMLGALGALFIIIRKLFYGYTVMGWPSTVVLILLLGGIQLVMLGLIGEYLWQNLDESRNRPLFFIEKRSKTR
ncbi:MAG: glycosyltransferase family 2 protein [Candidatus Omnitrophica bacterium]|nr:glycosyltransferase family 2 protein [Candidatus Omnitrophota bacterium]MBU1808963.1 glycosyltransferase family 2 protein [Candidatus Omnitrophota bacterium]